MWVEPVRPQIREHRACHAWRLRRQAPADLGYDRARLGTTEPRRVTVRQLQRPFAVEPWLALSGWRSRLVCGFAGRGAASCALSWRVDFAAGRPQEARPQRGKGDTRRQARESVPCADRQREQSMLERLSPRKARASDALPGANQIDKSLWIWGDRGPAMGARSRRNSAPCRQPSRCSAAASARTRRGCCFRARFWAGG